MPTFAFSGRTRGGENISGERVADNADAAVAALRREQVLVTRIAPAKEKGEAAAAVEEGQARQEGQPQEPGGVRAAVLRHDRRRPAAGAVSPDSRSQEEDKNFAETILADRSRRRKRRIARGRDGEAPEGVRPAVHEHDRGRRGRRYSRHDPEASRDVHRKGGQAQGPGEVRDDLSDRGHRDCRRRRRRHSVEGHPDVRGPVRRPWCRAAAADAHRHRAQRLPGQLHAVHHRRASSRSAGRSRRTTGPPAGSTRSTPSR